MGSESKEHLAHTGASTQVLPSLSPLLSDDEVEWIGVLRPVPGSNSQQRIDIVGDVFSIGREKPAMCVLADRKVSALHALIEREENDFVIHDLQSSNGTYVDRVPVIDCELHDGDEVRIGDLKYYFSRRTRRTDLIELAVPAGDRPALPNQSDLRITFRGTRGSLPVPGRKTEKIGGNTTCVELRHRDTIVVFDAGTGIRTVSDHLTQEFSEAAVTVNLLLTHLHWDHIQGFPFFVPAWQPRNTVRIFGQSRSEKSIFELLSGQMHGEYFPAQIADMEARLQFETAADQFDIDELRIRTLSLPHPGGCLGYRIEADGAVLVFATDCEIDQIVGNADDVKRDPETARSIPDEFIGFFTDADLVVIDCQYSDKLYQQRVGWGHNSPSAVIDLCRQTRPRQVALTHHDPHSTDADVAEIVIEVARRLAASASDPPLVFAAREGLTMKVKMSESPRRSSPSK